MREKIYALIKELKPQAEVDADTPLMNEVLDSIEMISLLEELENAFHITIPSAEIKAENFSSVIAIEALIGKCM